MSNGQVQEIRRVIDCHSVNVIHYLKCEMCNEKEIYIGKTIETDNAKGFKIRINQHISDYKTAVSTCKFPCHVYNCGITNNCLEQLFFSLNIMLRLFKGQIETIEKQFHLKGYETVNNHGRN